MNSSESTASGISGLYTLMSTVSSSSLERTQRNWVGWENYCTEEGETIAQKQKDLGLVEDLICKWAFCLAVAVGSARPYRRGPAWFFPID